MKIVTFGIYITICFLIIGCKKSTSTIRDNAYDSVEKYETELEKLWLYRYCPWMRGMAAS